MAMPVPQASRTIIIPTPLRSTPSRLPSLVTLPVRQPALPAVQVLPNDVLRLFLSFLNLRDKARFSGVCRAWRVVALNITHFHKSQLEARITILTAISEKGHGLTSGDSELLEKAKEYLNTQDADLEKNVIPPLNPRALRSTVEKIAKTYSSKPYIYNPKVPQNYLTVLLQDAIQRSIQGWMPLYSHSLLRIANLEVYPAGANPSLTEGVRDCLMPILHPYVEKWIRDKKSDRDYDKVDEFEANDGICELGSSFGLSEMMFTQPMFAVILELIVQSKHLKHLAFNCVTRGLPHGEMMRILNKELPHCQHLRVLTFGNANREVNTDWLGENGLESLRETLVGLPHLQKLVFKNLKTPMNVSNAEALAKILIARSEHKKCSNVDHVVFGFKSITVEAAQAFLEALKDYKDPINITFANFGINLEAPFQEWPLLTPHYEHNPNLQIRFDDGVDRTTRYVYDPNGTGGILPVGGLFGAIDLGNSHIFGFRPEEAKKFFKERRKVKKEGDVHKA